MLLELENLEQSIASRARRQTRREDESTTTVRSSTEAITNIGHDNMVLYPYYQGVFPPCTWEPPLLTTLSWPSLATAPMNPLRSLHCYLGGMDCSGLGLPFKTTCTVQVWHCLFFQKQILSPSRKKSAEDKGSANLQEPHSVIAIDERQRSLQQKPKYMESCLLHKYQYAQCWARQAKSTRVNAIVAK